VYRVIVRACSVTTARTANLVNLLFLVGAMALGVAAVGFYAGLGHGSRGSGGTGVWASIRRVWRYVGVRIRVLHDELADPKVQLEQAIEEAQLQHRRLTENAANVIANQRSLQQRLERATGQYERLRASAAQALVLADHQRRAGDASSAGTFEQAAESYAGRLLDLEGQIRETQGTLLQAATAADRAKEMVTEDAARLHQQLRAKERLLSDLDRARMQEQMNRASAQLSAELGGDVPTFAEVERKVQMLLNRAMATAELDAVHTSPAFDGSMLEVERAQRSVETQARLAALRTSLGLPPAEPIAIEARTTEGDTP
jgi:phage shock protein A